jgi:hypothetical protein
MRKIEHPKNNVFRAKYGFHFIELMTKENMGIRG